MEDELLEQSSKEKDKSGMKKGGRRYQRKAQEAMPKSKRSSRRKL